MRAAFAIATTWLGALAAFAACGDSGSSPDNGDAAPDVVVADDAAAGDARDGCAPGEEDVGGTCAGVVPAGLRRLALEVNPASGADYAAKLDVAKSVGVSVIPITLPWGYLLETSVTDGGPPVIDASWFTAIDGALRPRVLSLLLSIPFVDTVEVQAPSDLRAKIEAGTMTLDDPAVIARYEDVVDAYFASVDPALDLGWLVVSNEADVYLANKPQAAWDALARFLAAVRDHVHGMRPTTRVGINVTFGGIADAASVARITTLTAGADVAFVSYYEGSNGFDAGVGSDVAKDLDRIVAYAGAKPLVLKELGYATGVTGHSPAGQVDFVTAAFRGWDAHAAAIPLLVTSRMYDGNRPDCEASAKAYGFPGNEEFIQFLCTLGLRAFDDTPKPAWQRFVDAARARGF